MKTPLKTCFCQIGKGGLGGLKRGKVPYFCRGGLSILQVNEGMALGWPQTEVGVVLGGRLGEVSLPLGCIGGQCGR